MPTVAAPLFDDDDDLVTEMHQPLTERDLIKAERERIRSEIDPFRNMPAPSATSASPAPPASYPGATATPVIPPVPPVETQRIPSRGSDAPTTVRPDPPAAAVAGKPTVQVRRLRRGRLAIRKIDPWAVLKFSLVFYFCMLLIMLLGTAIIFATLKAFGVIDSFEKLLRDLDLNVSITGGVIFRWFFLIGLLGTVIFSAVTTFMSFLYNLIADVVGGIELLVTERE